MKKFIISVSCVVLIIASTVSLVACSNKNIVEGETKYVFTSEHYEENEYSLGIADEYMQKLCKKCIKVYLLDIPVFTIATIINGTSDHSSIQIKQWDIGDFDEKEFGNYGSSSIKNNYYLRILATNVTKFKLVKILPLVGSCDKIAEYIENINKIHDEVQLAKYKEKAIKTLPRVEWIIDLTKAVDSQTAN